MVCFNLGLFSKWPLAELAQYAKALTRLFGFTPNLMALTKAALTGLIQVSDAELPLPFGVVGLLLLFGFPLSQSQIFQTSSRTFPLKRNPDDQTLQSSYFSQSPCSRKAPARVSIMNFDWVVPYLVMMTASLVLYCYWLPLLSFMGLMPEMKCYHL